MLARKFQSTAPAMANYNFNDIADGTGAVLFYAGECSDSAANTYVLSPDVFYSTDITQFKYSVAASDTIQFDIDYDTKVNLPRTINGNVLVNVTAGIYKDSGEYEFSVYFKIYVRKVTTGGEVEIANNTSETWIDTGAIGVHDKSFAIEVPVTNAQIKKGESIRITIEMHGWSDIADDGNRFNYGQDPTGRDDPDGLIVTPETTELKVWIPFKVEV